MINSTLCFGIFMACKICQVTEMKESSGYTSATMLVQLTLTDTFIALLQVVSIYIVIILVVARCLCPTEVQCSLTVALFW